MDIIYCNMKPQKYELAFSSLTDREAKAHLYGRISMKDNKMQKRHIFKNG